MRYLILLLILLFAVPAVADDGEMLRRNVSKTPELESEHASLKMLNFYVPAQASDGTLLPGVEYYDADGALVDTREYSKPLISTYIDGHAEEVEGTAFSHGERDAFAAVSLDDGESWKRTNLSNSGDLSSFSVQEKKKWVPYPGDVVTMFMASAGNKVLAVWASRYAQGGSPNYAMTDEERKSLAIYLGLQDEEQGDCTDSDLVGTPCLYLEDIFGVAGSQGSSDFADEGYPEVGVVPFSALWAARGTLELVDTETGLYDIIWRKPERLTSAVRDVNRIEAQCVAGAGCAITWQEDPEGLRPGEGEGPGEGWSGAIAHHQTDIWYSYIGWDHFDLVDNDGLYGEPVTLDLYGGDGAPAVGIPFSMPVRLTDNAMCAGETTDSDDPYCFVDFDESGTADFCATKVNLTITDPVTGQPTEIPNVCVAEDGRLMRGNIASTRARLNLRGYDSDSDGIDDSAWVITAYEESKGLGEEEVDAGLIDQSDPAEYTKVDMGKNIWYHTFDMFNPELVSQGLMLNQPAQYPDDFSAVGSLVSDSSLGYNFMQIEPDPIYETQAGLESTLYQSEIARRFSLISQPGSEVGPSGTIAFAMWKQGIIRQGGPADVMARRFVLPDDFDPAIHNPFAYANMACDQWAFTDGSNPRYVKGLCVAPATSLSTTTIVLGDTCSDETTCEALFPWNAYFDDIEGGTQLAKIQEWRWCDGVAAIEGCISGESDLDDTSWDNPYDVAKGHRGFIDGDFIMVLYAWSPNWLANTVGHDNYNLYIRRSFDGGQTWTTTPSSGSPYLDSDITYSGTGTTTCEWMGPAGGDTEYPVCTTYAAGSFEQARNVSQLVGLSETILDPRYSPTMDSITAENVPDGFDGGLYEDDIRDPSRYFIVYETGDNTTVAEGEAEPLDLYYSRAVTWGDHYLVWAEETDLSAALPSSDPDDELLNGFYNEFDTLEGSQTAMSGEASVTANPGGTFFYGVWNQEDLDRKGDVVGSDAWFRRVMFIDDYVPVDDGGVGPPPPPSEQPGKPNKE